MNKIESFISGGFGAIDIASQKYLIILILQKKMFEKMTFLIKTVIS